MRWKEGREMRKKEEVEAEKWKKGKEKRGNEEEVKKRKRERKIKKRKYERGGIREQRGK